MEKSYVGMGHEVCPVCCKEHSECVLLDERMRKKFTQGKSVPTGWALCEEHKQQIADGYVIFIVIDADKSPAPYEPDTVFRTGDVVSMKANVFEALFNTGLPPQRIAFCAKELVDEIRKRTQVAEEVVTAQQTN